MTRQRSNRPEGAAFDAAVEGWFSVMEKVMMILDPSVRVAGEW
jgi:hypothetical protein